jgi:hypothetical protein
VHNSVLDCRSDSGYYNVTPNGNIRSISNNNDLISSPDIYAKLSKLIFAWNRVA